MSQTVEIVATRNFCYWHRTAADDVGRRIVTTGTTEAFPMAVADKAVEKGAAALPGTSEANAAVKFCGATDHITMAHCVNLGDPLGVLPSE